MPVYFGIRVVLAITNNVCLFGSDSYELLQSEGASTGDLSGIQHSIDDLTEQIEALTPATTQYHGRVAITLTEPSAVDPAVAPSPSGTRALALEYTRPEHISLWLAAILILTGGAILPAPAVPSSTRI